MYETMMGLLVTDDAKYTQYRAEMAPLLEAHGGSFGVDVRVSEVLKSPAGRPFNRLFTLRFPSKERREAFFSAPAYLEIRSRLFDTSVAEVNRLAVYGEE